MASKPADPKPKGPSVSERIAVLEKDVAKLMKLAAANGWSHV